MGRYFTELVDVLTAAGVRCSVGDQNRGWETRARSSGGYADGLPRGSVWHHTASRTTPANDLAYMCHNSDDAPIGNLLLDRAGVVWPIAAGAANTQGKGGPLTFSTGTVPVDAGNSQLFGLEVANDGVGEVWPAVQIDAYFATSLALAALFGVLPTDIATHHEWAPTRKVDPATAAAVDGWWIPGSVTTSGTWDGADIRGELVRRSSPVPPLPPPDQEEPSMLALDLGTPGVDPWWTRLTYTGAELVHVVSPADQLQARGGVPVVSTTEDEVSALLDTVTTVGGSPFHAAGQAPNTALDDKWNRARGRT